MIQSTLETNEPKNTEISKDNKYIHPKIKSKSILGGSL